MQNETSAGRLIIVANRLPVTVTLDKKLGQVTCAASPGGLASALSGLQSRMATLWIGWPGVSAESADHRALISEHLAKLDALPVFIPKEQFERYYDGFSNGCLWPLFHYFAQFADCRQDEWSAYVRVNEKFCEEILEVAQPGDHIWVHDYQLMLLPAMLRKRLPEAHIGFFLHIPFPSFEILRNLPWRSEIIEGILGADLIGFHTFSYARHFFSSLLRLLGLKHDFGRILLADRAVKVDVFPLGVDVPHLEEIARRPGVVAATKNLREKAQQRKIMLSVDRLDFTKGILRRLRAYETFLSRRPDWHEKVVFMVLCVPSRERVPQYAALKRQVDELVGRINGHFARPGWQPIWYMYRSLPFEELAPMYLAADVAMVTPLRDGMNLVSKEYLGMRADKTGALILSETAGSAEELGEAIIVNPHDSEQLVGAIERALDMSPEEQARRNDSMRTRLSRYSASQWGEDFLRELEATCAERERYHVRRLDDNRLAVMLERYRAASRRLILLDYDGTLVRFAATADEAQPDSELLQTLAALRQDARNDLVIISGRDRTTLNAWLGEIGANLIAEHGACNRTSGEADWTCEESGMPEGWQRPIRTLLEIYADRTPGAYVEDKGGSLAWHYRKCEPELAGLRANELMAALERFVANTPLHVMQGNKVLEVKSSAVNKGRAAQKWLRNGTCYDFMLAIGDDVTDEDTFRMMPETAWTIRVGSATEPSHARFCVAQVKEARSLLEAMSGK